MNKYLVGANHAGLIVIQNPPRGRISPADALELAAWIVVMAEPNAPRPFAEVLEEVQS